MSQPNEYNDMLVGTVVEVRGPYVECSTDSGGMFVAVLDGLVDESKPGLLPGELVAAPMAKVVTYDLSPGGRR